MTMVCDAGMGMTTQMMSLQNQCPAAFVQQTQALLIELAMGMVQGLIKEEIASSLL